MKTGMFAVYDLKAKAFLQPFFSVTEGTAIRAFAVAVNDPGTMLAKHPGDYVLFEVGSFDDDSGFLAALSPVKQLCIAAAVKEQVPQGEVPFAASDVKANGEDHAPQS